MIEEPNVDSFEVEKSCDYRGETYRVRDNGAALRVARPGLRRRPLDEKWTFGTPSKHDGYAAISGHKVHRIVATAFHGEQPIAFVERRKAYRLSDETSQAKP